MHQTFDLNQQKENNNNLTPLISEIDSNYKKIFDFLIEQKVDIEVADINWETAIFHAFKSRSDTFTEQLLANDCNVCLENKKGKTSLISALQTNHENAVKIIYEKDKETFAKSDK